jgi:hypothetical protein
MKRKKPLHGFGLLELVNFSLELELLKLGGGLLHTGVLQSSIDGGGLNIRIVTFRWNDLHFIPDLRHCFSK